MEMLTRPDKVEYTLPGTNFKTLNFYFKFEIIIK